MEPDRKQPLEYATPRREPSVPFGPLVRGFGLLLVLAGIVWAALGTVGLDNRTQILTGWVIIGFGVIVGILGQILHAVETRR
jgi:hypothetical protein